MAPAKPVNRTGSPRTEKDSGSMKSAARHHDSFEALIRVGVADEPSGVVSPERVQPGRRIGCAT